MRVLIVSDCYSPRLGGIETQVRDLARNLKLAGHEPAVGRAVQRIIGAVLNDEQRVLTISPLLDNWHGISDVCMAVPTIVGREGAGRRLELPLTSEEKERLTASADHLREVARGLGY